MANSDFDENGQSTSRASKAVAGWPGGMPKLRTLAVPLMIAVLEHALGEALYHLVVRLLE